MDGALRMGAWLALTVAAHAALLVAVPIWRAPGTPRALECTIHWRVATAQLGAEDPDPLPATGPVPAQINECELRDPRPDPRPGTAESYVPSASVSHMVLPTRCGDDVPAPRVLTVPVLASPLVDAPGPPRCACCQNGCDTCARGGFCECRYPGVYDGFDPARHPQVRSQIRPADPGCCKCTASWIGR